MIISLFKHVRTTVNSTRSKSKTACTARPERSERLKGGTQWCRWEMYNLCGTQGKILKTKKLIQTIFSQTMPRSNNHPVHVQRVRAREHKCIIDVMHTKYANRVIITIDPPDVCLRAYCLSVPYGLFFVFSTPPPLPLHPPRIATCPLLYG